MYSAVFGVELVTGLNLNGSKRLRVRIFTSEDIPSLMDLMSDPDTMKFIGPRRSMSESEVKEWLDNKILNQDHITTKHAICLTSGELIGVCGIDKNVGVCNLNEEYSNSWDFGYYFRKNFFGGKVLPQKLAS